MKKLSFNEWLQNNYKITEIELYETEWVWNYICEQDIPEGFGFTKEQWVQANIDNISDEYGDYIKNFEKSCNILPLQEPQNPLQPCLDCVNINNENCKNCLGQNQNSEVSYWSKKPNKTII